MTTIAPTVVERTLAVVAHVAVSDCERIRPGLIAQPVNTASSLAYCVSGGWLLRAGPRAADRRALGLAAIAAGLGSVAYHGPGGVAARLFHDITALALAGTSMTAALRHPVSPARRVALVAVVSAGIDVHAASRTDRVLCRPGSPWQGHALWHLLSAAAVAVATPA